MTKIVKSSDSSVYKGELDQFGKRTGFGTLRTPVMVYNPNDSSEVPTLTQWLEYQGEWSDDEANGKGIMRRYRGDGTSVVIYEGEWSSGEPVFKPGVSAC